MTDREVSDKKDTLFFARLDDLAAAAEGGVLSHTDFLSPAEQAAGERYLVGKRGKICAYGGYLAAERRQIFFLPAYMDTETGDPRELLAVFPYVFEDIAVLSVKGSGFRAFSHRDVLGSVLSLGVRRGAIGDILCRDDATALLFCTSAVAPFLCEELHKVGGDTVKTSQVTVDPDLPSDRKFLTITDTVASARLDAVLAALCRLSRDKAQDAIRARLVELNYEEADKNDAAVGAGDVLSVRGIGKFIVRSLDETTKKGRIRLRADKYL